MEEDVEERDHDIRDRQVHQEVVGDRAHALVRQYNPDDNDVPAGGYDEDEDEHGVEDGLLPPW